MLAHRKHERFIVWFLAADYSTWSHSIVQWVGCYFIALSNRQNSIGSEKFGYHAQLGRIHWICTSWNVVLGCDDASYKVLYVRSEGHPSATLSQHDCIAAYSRWNCFPSLFESASIPNIVQSLFSSCGFLQRNHFTVGRIWHLYPDWKRYCW